MFGKKDTLSAAITAQLRLLIREEVREEIKLQVSPAFMDLMTTGRGKMEQLLDLVVAHDTELDRLKEAVVQLQEASLQP